MADHWCSPAVLDYLVAYMLIPRSVNQEIRNRNPYVIMTVTLMSHMLFVTTRIAGVADKLAA